MTVSPWSCMIMRNTPCVLGCWGPRLRVSRFSSSTTPTAPGVSKIESPSSAPSGGARPGIIVSAICVRASQSVRLVDELFDGDVVEVSLVVAAHGETDEIVGQQNATQVRVAEEANAHHLERFAFHELRAWPHRRE